MDPLAVLQMGDPNRGLSLPFLFHRPLAFPNLLLPNQGRERYEGQ